MRILVLAFLLFSIPAFCQKKIRTIEVSDSIMYATIDRPGDLYIITKSGQIQKFDENGNMILLYKSTNIPTLFDPRDGARLFTYYRSTQQYEFLNPSFEATASYHVDSSFAIKPWLICPSGETKLWVLDSADHSLKKINTKESVVEVEVLIDSTLIYDASSFTTMREYQGFVFLLNPKSGILIFNGLGKNIKTLEVKGISNFQFLGEELYYTKSGGLHLFDLFTADERKIDLPSESKFSILTGTRLFQVFSRSIVFSEFSPH
jgi:hypothetical protein